MSNEELYGCGIGIEKLLDYWRNALPPIKDYAELVGAPGSMVEHTYMIINQDIS